MSKLQEEHNVLKDSFNVLGQEKNESQIAKKAVMDQALMAKTHLPSLQAKLDNVKGNSSDEVRDKIIDNFIQ